MSRPRSTQRQAKERHSPSPDGRILRDGTTVNTPDGPGTITGQSMRRNTNGGPGCREYVVKLTDGRIRHYNANSVE